MPQQIILSQQLNQLDEQLQIYEQIQRSSTPTQNTFSNQIQPFLQMLPPIISKKAFNITVRPKQNSINSKVSLLKEENEVGELNFKIMTAGKHQKIFKSDKRQAHRLAMSIIHKASQSKTNQKKFRSTKAVKLIKVQNLRESIQNMGLKALKQEYKIREISLQKYLSDPKVLQNYKMLSHLGKGCFSIVSLAMDKVTNVRHAIKVYNKIDEIQSFKFDNIYREINHLFDLKHQNVVNLFHVVMDMRKVKLVMEDAGKTSLAGLLRKSRVIPENQAKIIFRQALQGIQYCHSKAICHRDLKLQNILIDEQNVVKIIDFGFSSKCHNKLQNYCGTPPYMAPEIVSKTPYNGEPADMWALGILLYLMLNGRFPFRANNEKQLFRLIQQGKFQITEGVSQPAKDLIGKMLKCSIKDRWSAEQALESSWLKYK